MMGVSEIMMTEKLSRWVVIDETGWWGLWGMVQRNSKRSHIWSVDPESFVSWGKDSQSLDQTQWERPAAPSGCAWRLKKIQVIPFEKYNLERAEWKDTNILADSRASWEGRQLKEPRS